MKQLSAALALGWICLMSSPASAEGVIAWSGEVADSQTADAGAVLGAPDGRSTGLGDYHYVWVRKFANVADYGDGLGAVLGLGPGELAGWDVIAFEDNGGSGASGGGWESSLWFFTDQEHAIAAAFNEATAAANPPDGGVMFRSGSIPGAVYGSLFGASTSSEVVSWILVSVPDEIDTRSDRFSVWVSGALIGEGSPDPDAIGVVR